MINPEPPEPNEGCDRCGQGIDHDIAHPLCVGCKEIVEDQE